MLEKWIKLRIYRLNIWDEMRCLFYGAPASELPKAARGRSTGSTNWEPFSRRARLQMRYTDGGVWMMMMMMGDLNDEWEKRGEQSWIRKYSAEYQIEWQGGSQKQKTAKWKAKHWEVIDTLKSDNLNQIFTRRCSRWGGCSRPRSTKTVQGVARPQRRIGIDGDDSHISMLANGWPREFSVFSLPCTALGQAPRILQGLLDSWMGC